MVAEPQRRRNGQKAHLDVHPVELGQRCSAANDCSNLKLVRRFLQERVDARRAWERPGSRLEWTACGQQCRQTGKTKKCSTLAARLLNRNFRVPHRCWSWPSSRPPAFSLRLPLLRVYHGGVGRGTERDSVSMARTKRTCCECACFLLFSFCLPPLQPHSPQGYL